MTTQSINIRLESESGKVLKECSENYAEINNFLQHIDNYQNKYEYLAGIDEFGDTLFNYKQVPKVIIELKKLLNEKLKFHTKTHIQLTIDFLKHIDIHKYIHFSGD